MKPQPPIPSEPESFRPPKAYQNRPFLASSAARNIRMLCEMTEPADRLAKQGVKNTIVMFGSARIKDPEAAKNQFDNLAKELGTDDPETLEGEAKLSLLKAKRGLRAAKYYAETREVARLISEWSLKFPRPEDRYYICSGGGPGIMEAANRGAHDAGAASMGLSISLPFEQSVNPYCTPDITFEFHYFMLRKWWFLYPAKALITFPGGFGTFDELFEMLTLIQTRKTTKPMSVVLYGSEFWNEVVNFQKLADWGVISQEDLSLFKVSDDPKEAAESVIQFIEEHYPKKP